MNRYDLIIIGGGPAGYIPAIRAAQLGRHVAVVEEEDLGGTCLNRGCIPTKTLVASTSLLRHAASAKRYGLEGELSFSWDKLARRKDLVVKRLRKGIEAHFSNLGIDVIREHGTIKGSNEVLAGNALLSTENILLSPGSVPIQPGPFALDGVQTSRDVLAWDSLPESLIIVGGGVIGCEFASIFSSLGVKITIIEMLPSILPGVDEDVTEVV
ncbi:MAG: FAD-dependent oxidoreductase, partial [Candidatus Fermentibacteraceae bacterium]|nr:FAD-dependent oxidoreductase [Candidatus Fermentibacteraceae bacterium]